MRSQVKPHRAPHPPDFSHGAPAPRVRVMGDKHARDDKATAQTTNRCRILGNLSHRHRSRRNRYNDSSKTRTNPAATVVRGASALAASVTPRHRLKVNVVSAKQPCVCETTGRRWRMSISRTSGGGEASEKRHQKVFPKINALSIIS